MGNKDRKYNFCGTTLFAGKNRPLCRRQHAVCPVTLAMRQQILRIPPVPSTLGGPFAAPLFASLSALGNSQWMRLQLYFRVCGLLIRLHPLYTIANHLSSIIFSWFASCCRIRMGLFRSAKENRKSEPPLPSRNAQSTEVFVTHCPQIRSGASGLIGLWEKVQRTNVFWHRTHSDFIHTPTGCARNLRDSPTG